MSNPSVKVAVCHQWEESEQWSLVANADAEYGPEGVKFNRPAFAYNFGEELADYMEEALRNFGESALAGFGEPGFGVAQTTLDFEDGNGKWTLSVTR